VFYQWRVLKCEFQNKWLVLKWQEYEDMAVALALSPKKLLATRLALREVSLLLYYFQAWS